MPKETEPHRQTYKTHRLTDINTQHRPTHIKRNTHPLTYKQTNIQAKTQTQTKISYKSNLEYKPTTSARFISFN